MDCGRQATACRPPFGSIWKEMKTIRDAFDMVRTILGGQKYKIGTNYQKTAFCLEAACPEGQLLYHTLTGELVLLHNNETWAGDLGLTKALVEHWFLIPSDMDEIKLCHQVRQVADLLKQERPYINNYTVFTTTDCNARCFYCFEHGQRRYSMTEQTARDVSTYMLDHANGKKISIRWFGGEPLYNAKAIDIISETLRDQDAPFDATMVSNAYLFDTTIAKRAKELWHLKHVLVTIDGTEEVYNRTKAFIYREGSAFRRVLQSIRTVLDAGIGVTVRLNMDAANALDLLELADELGRQFSGFQRFTTNARLLIDYLGNIHAFETAEQALDALKTLNERLESLGIREHLRLRSELLLNACLADHAHSATVLPDGRLGRCEHFGDSQEVGSIYGAWDAQKADAWKEPKPIEQRCRTCPFYPECFRLLKCNGIPHICNELFRGQREMDYLDRIRNTYAHFKEKNGGQNETDM